MSVYDRQDRIEGINKNLRICIAGAGGIGYWAAKFFAMSGVDDITIFDPDTLEESNLNRLDLTYEYVGRNKAQIVRDVVGQIRPECKVRALPFPVKPHTFPKDVDVFVDCTDSFKSQLEHENLCKENGIRYAKFGYDGTRISISKSIPLWDTSNEDADGYRITPSWVVPAVTVAALGVGQVMKYTNREMGCDLSELYWK